MHPFMKENCIEATIIIFAIIVLTIIIISSIFIYIKYLQNKEETKKDLSFLIYKEDIDEMFKPIIQEIKLFHKEIHNKILSSNFLLPQLKEQNEIKTDEFTLDEICKNYNKEFTDDKKKFEDYGRFLSWADNSHTPIYSFNIKLYCDAKDLDKTMRIRCDLFSGFKQHTGINFVPMFAHKNDSMNEVSIILVFVSNKNTIVGVCTGIKINLLLGK